MYDMIVKTVSLTCDEVDILKPILEHYQETASRVDEMIIEGLLEKLDKV